MQLILCGGGDGEQNTQANQRLNEIIDHTKPILYIPLAMDEIEHPYDECYEWIKEELRNVDVPSIKMVRTFEELASENLEEYTALFIGGGNTYKLLLGLKQTMAFNNIKNSTYVNCFDNQKFSITQNRDEKLCFSIDTIIPKPYILLWKIKNNGNYAIENNSLRGEIYYGNNLNSFADDSQSFKRFESISFKGNHYVECYLIKDNKCIAKSRFNVNIE